MSKSSPIWNGAFHPSLKVAFFSLSSCPSILILCEKSKSHGESITDTVNWHSYWARTSVYKETGKRARETAFLLFRYSSCRSWDSAMRFFVSCLYSLFVIASQYLLDLTNQIIFALLFAVVSATWYYPADQRAPEEGSSQRSARGHQLDNNDNWGGERTYSRWGTGRYGR